MRFGELFSKSWQEYKQNFKVFAIIFLLLSVIPTIISFLVSIPSTLEALKLGTTQQTFLGVFFSWKYLLVIIFGIITFLLGLWMSVSFIYNSLYRKKEMSVRETLSGGKKYFWKYLLFSIVYGIFLIGLFLLFIIPGIIFMIFWVFSSYVLIGQNKGILESLKTSREIVRGKWWHTFGFLLLFGLIMIGISLVFSIGAGLINLIFGFSAFPFSQANIEAMMKAISSPSTLIITNLISRIFSLGANLIIAPLSVLFFKNFYLDMKGGSKVKKS